MKQQDKFGSGYASCGGCGGGIDIFMGENFAWGAPLDGRILPWTGQPADSHGDLIPLNNGKYEQLTRPYSAVKNNLRDFLILERLEETIFQLEVEMINTITLYPIPILIIKV